MIQLICLSSQGRLFLRAGWRQSPRRFRMPAGSVSSRAGGSMHFHVRRWLAPALALFLVSAGFAQDKAPLTPPKASKTQAAPPTSSALQAPVAPPSPDGVFMLIDQ